MDDMMIQFVNTSNFDDQYMIVGSRVGIIQWEEKLSSLGIIAYKEYIKSGQKTWYDMGVKLTNKMKHIEDTRTPQHLAESASLKWDA